MSGPIRDEEPEEPAGSGPLPLDSGLFAIPGNTSRPLYPQEYPMPPELPQQESGLLTPIWEMTTAHLVPPERWRDTMSLRERRIHEHESAVAYLQSTMQETQHALYCQAESAADLYRRWVLLRANLRPTLQQITSYRNTQQELSVKLGFMEQLSAQWRYQAAEVKRHEDAAATLRQTTTGAPR